MYREAYKYLLQELVHVILENHDLPSLSQKTSEVSVESEGLRADVVILSREPESQDSLFLRAPYVLS